MGSEMCIRDRWELQIRKVHELGIHMFHRRHDVLDAGMQLAGTKGRERGSAAKFKHDQNLYARDWEPVQHPVFRTDGVQRKQEKAGHLKGRNDT